jgi:hypothetical protein
VCSFKHVKPNGYAESATKNPSVEKFEEPDRNRASMLNSAGRATHAQEKAKEKYSCVSW